MAMEMQFRGNSGAGAGDSFTHTLRGLQPCPIHPYDGGSADVEEECGVQRYCKLEKIGEGSYGKVYKCKDKYTGAVVAIKIIAWSYKDGGVPSTSIREVALLKELRHPNIVRLLEVIPEDGKLLLVFEYLDKDLKRMLDLRCTPIIGRKLKLLMYQLLTGLHACHSRRIVHRDIKPNNILISQDETIAKIADFGLSRTFTLHQQEYTQEVTTLYYRAPEILLGETHYTPAVDIWSIGCVFGELAMRKPLFCGEGEFSQLITIFQVLGTPTEQTWPGVSMLPHYNNVFPFWKSKDLFSMVSVLDPKGVDLLASLLKYVPEQRPTALQALQHEWFDEVREAAELAMQQRMKPVV